LGWQSRRHSPAAAAWCHLRARRPSR
jgi:hypothetical protein